MVHVEVIVKEAGTPANITSTVQLIVLVGHLTLSWIQDTETPLQLPLDHGT